MVITDLDNGQCGVPNAFGCTSDSTHIEIDDDLAAEFEQNSNANPPAHQVWSSRVSYGRDAPSRNVSLGKLSNGVAETDGDAGDKFETAVYGGTVD